MLAILEGTFHVFAIMALICLGVLGFIITINLALELLDDTMSLWDDLTGWFPDEED